MLPIAKNIPRCLINRGNGIPGLDKVLAYKALTG